MDPYSEKVATTHIAIIHETWRESVARDLTTVIIFVGMWSIGYFASSPALQWAGVMVASLTVLGRAMARIKGVVDRRMTPDQARAWLNNKFPQ